MSRPAAIVFCERLDNESFCESIVRELATHVDVRPCGPGWPVADLEEVDTEGAAFYLELDAASGRFVRPGGLERLRVPKFAWLVDTHKKPEFHRQIARDMDLTFFAMQRWGHVLDAGPRVWLPLHADARIFRPVEAERLWDVAFVGSQPWRAEALERLARAHGLQVLVTTTTGPAEKSETASIYARSRLVFNRHVANDLNFRVFEALACGRVLLTDAQPNGQYELLEDGRHAIVYKDDGDLERQVLRLLGDAELRTRIEREAAQHARAHHTTAVRVAQLVRHLEVFIGRPLGPREQAAIVETTTPDAARQAAPPTPLPAPVVGPRRWLVVAGAEAPTVDLRSYAERLGRGLAARGHEVTVVRPRGRRLPPLSRGGTDEPVVVELDAGPLPRARTRENAMLTAAAPFLRQVDELARERGPFDAVLAEGPLGQLSGPALAERCGLPLLLALSSCEVLARSNRLSLNQLYTAELEHWAAARADVVLCPWPELEAAAREHYRCQRLVLASAPRPCARSSRDEGTALLAELGLPGPFVLVLAQGPAGGARLADDRGVIWSSDEGTEALRASRRLGGRRARGPALAVLMLAADAVVLGPCDPARADAEALARRVVVTADVRDPEHALELAARAPAAPLAAPDDPAELLERALALALERRQERVHVVL